MIFYPPPQERGSLNEIHGAWLDMSTDSYLGIVSLSSLELRCSPWNPPPKLKSLADQLRQVLDPQQPPSTNPGIKMYAGW
jgi:hypothetical protein